MKTIFFSCLAGASWVALSVTDLAAQSTGILNKAALAGANAPDTQWYIDNIPFLDCPDATVQQIYYYRWKDFKSHIKNTGWNSPGYVITEFLVAPFYAGEYGGIDCAAGHNIREARWLRDQTIGADYINYFFRGNGLPRQYSFWAADSVYQRYLANGDPSFVFNYLPDLEANYEGWISGNYDSTQGLFKQYPVWDGMERTIGALSSADTYSGEFDFRPSINSYMYGDAIAIQNMATMAGDNTTASLYANRAQGLRTNIVNILWNNTDRFFEHKYSATLQFIPGREEIGFTPWYFNLPADTNTYSQAWSELLDPQGFYANYGPTTAERRHPLYYITTGCCWWNGPVWPYSTTVTLVAMANLLNNYHQSYITTANYFDILKKYASSQYLNGQPMIEETTDPDSGQFLDNSEDYQHSGYADLIITGLVGLRPQANNSIVVNPLVPTTWDYFCMEDVPYHGHLVTILWDRTGSHYNHGKGLQVFVDNSVVTSSTTIAKITGTIPAAVTPIVAGNHIDLAFNPTVTGAPTPLGYPQPSASYSNTNNGDSVWNAVDGNIWYYDTAQTRNRWTCASTPNASDSFVIDFGSPKYVSQVNLAFYSDGSTVFAPYSYGIQYWNGYVWLPVNNPVISPTAPIANTSNTVSFDPVRTRQIRAVFQNHVATGLCEIQAFAPNYLNDNSSFAENFALPSSVSRFTAYEGAATVSGDVLTTSSTNSGNTIIANGTDISDLEYEGDISTGGTGDGGLIFRATNVEVGDNASNSYYAALCPASQLVELYYLNGNFALLASTPMAVNQGTVYHMKVVAIGANIQVFVTDMNNPKITFSDTHLSRGGIGLREYNSTLTAANLAANKLTSPVASPSTDLAFNTTNTGFPSPSASYTNGIDSLWEPLDGIISYQDTTPHNRWTCYNSGHASDWYQLDFGSAVTFNQVVLDVYDDGGGVRANPYNLQYSKDGTTWIDCTNQIMNPPSPTGDASNTDTFDSVNARYLRVVFTNVTSYSGMTEMQVFDKTNEGAQILTAVSRQVGPPGNLDLPLSTDGTASIESRQGATAGSYTFVLTFSDPVSNLTAALGLQSGQSGSVVGSVSSINYGPNSKTVTVAMTGVETAQHLNLHLSGASLANGSADLPVNLLVGDANGDGTVTSLDLVSVRNAIGLSSTDPTFVPLIDISADGRITSQDLVQVRNHLGLRLP
jgi:F5/8 type C domain/Dockerin type I domain